MSQNFPLLIWSVRFQLPRLLILQIDRSQDSLSPTTQICHVNNLNHVATLLSIVTKTHREPHKMAFHTKSTNMTKESVGSADTLE